MDATRQFSDLPQPLRRAIFCAAWRDTANRPGSGLPLVDRQACPFAGPSNRSQLRLVSRAACAAVDEAAEEIRVQAGSEQRLTALYACIRAVGSGRFPALRAWRLLVGCPPAAAEHVIRALAQAIPPTLLTLELWHVHLGQPAAAALAGAAAMPALRQLALRINGIDAAVLETLGQGFGPALEQLDLSVNRIFSDGAAVLARAAAARLPALRELNVSCNGIGDAGVRALVQMPWPALEILDLSRNGIRRHGAEALAGASATRLPALRALRLSGNELWDQGVCALVRHPWPLLQELHLGRNNVFRGEGAAALAGAPDHIPLLESLSLSENRLGAAGVAALLQHAPWPRLRSLDLSSAGVDEQGVAALAAASEFQLPALRELDLGHNSLGGAGIATLASGTWRRLEVLKLNDSKADKSGAVEALAAAGAARFPALRSLQVMWFALPVLSEEQEAALKAAWPGGISFV